MKKIGRSQKLPCDPPKPNNLGNCVLASTNAIPHLNPTRTVSETKLITTPAFTSHVINASAAAISAVHAANAAKRLVSPPARSPSDAPTSSEIADVTVMAVCRELQKIQKTNPENRHA